MITCPKCFKENQDHYKFCLGCGAELPRDVAPKPFTGNTPPHGIQAAQPAAPAFTPQREPSQPAFSASPQPAFQVAPAQPAFSPPPQAAAQPAPAPAPAGGPTPCPQCGHPNGPNNLFCGSCGFRLGGAKSNVAAPAVAAAPVHGQVVLTALRADGSEAGSYRYTLSSGFSPPPGEMNTLPSSSRLALKIRRSDGNTAPDGENWPEAGSYSSALLKAP